MSGHSKWAQIKHQKGVADQKRGAAFSRLLAAITVAAKNEPNPDFNPRLRAAIDKAKENHVPAENVSRAIKRATEAEQGFEELLFEAYGPGGVAILIEATTDSRNRTLAEIKHLLLENGGKWAEAGSVRWGFEQAEGAWNAKFPLAVSGEDRARIVRLVEAIRGHGDVQRIYTNAQY